MDYSFTKSEIPKGSLHAAFDLRNKYGGQRSVAKLKKTFDRKPVVLWPTSPYQQLFRFLFD